MEKRTIPEICQELRKLADRTEECHCYDLRNLSTRIIFAGQRI